MTPHQRHPRFPKFATYLAAKAPNGKLPGRQHIDLTENPRPLPKLNLVDSVLAAPGREPIRFERIALPLASDGETIDMPAGVHAFADS